MSGFATKQFANNGAVVLNRLPDLNQFSMTFNSFDENTSYLMWIAGNAQCGAPAGSMQHDVLLNGKKIMTRTIQTSSNQDTTPITCHWPIKCTDCTRVTEADGSITYKNEIILQFGWTPVLNLLNITFPSVEFLSVTVVAWSA